MNNGQYNGKQVLPSKALAATLEPAIALPNAAGQTRGWWKSKSGLWHGALDASYRGHLIAFHGGDLPGFHSQISFHAERAHRRDRVRDWQSHRAALQPDQLQRL